MCDLWCQQDVDSAVELLYDGFVHFATQFPNEREVALVPSGPRPMVFNILRLINAQLRKFSGSKNTANSLTRNS